MDTKNFKRRKGLKGPFEFADMVLYFDPVEKLYYNPLTDYFVYEDEMNQIHQRIIDALKV